MIYGRLIDGKAIVPVIFRWISLLILDSTAILHYHRMYYDDDIHHNLFLAVGER